LAFEADPERGNRKLVLLSHHQLFSPFGSVGSVNGTPYAYNPNLYDVFKDVLKKLEWWFWGMSILGRFRRIYGPRKRTVHRGLGRSSLPGPAVIFNRFRTDDL